MFSGSNGWVSNFNPPWPVGLTVNCSMNFTRCEKMCTIPLALSVASTVAGVYGQQQQVKAQNAYNDQQAKNAMEAYKANLEQTNLMQAQEHAAATQKVNENNRAAEAAKATALVSAESGIPGLSVDALLANLSGEQARYNESVNQNYENASMAIDNQRTNAHVNAASQINSLKTPQSPDYLGAALRIGQAAYDYKNPRVNSK